MNYLVPLTIVEGTHARENSNKNLFFCSLNRTFAGKLKNVNCKIVNQDDDSERNTRIV